MTFVYLLLGHPVSVAFPGRYPRFNKENLGSGLTANGIEYFHLPELGRRRFVPLQFI